MVLAVFSYARMTMACDMSRRVNGPYEPITKTACLQARTRACQEEVENTMINHNDYCIIILMNSKPSLLLLIMVCLIKLLQ